MAPAPDEPRLHCHGAVDRYHHIEEAVRVYLHASLDGQRWEICHTTVDGDGLFSDYDEPLQESCECDDPEACDEWADRLEKVGLPNGEGLLRLLADSLDYDLFKRADTDV